MKKVSFDTGEEFATSTRAAEKALELAEKGPPTRLEKGLQGAGVGALQGFGAGGAARVLMRDTPKGWLKVPAASAGVMAAVNGGLAASKDPELEWKKEIANLAEAAKLGAAKDEEPELYRSPLARLAIGGTGLGMVRGNVPTLQSMAMGRKELWHGTPPENMESILRSGLSMEYAGKNKRLNNLLMVNALMRDTEEFLKQKGVEYTDEIHKKLYEATDKFVSARSPAILSMADAARGVGGLSDTEAAVADKVIAGLKKQFGVDNLKPIHEAILNEGAAGISKATGVSQKELSKFYAERLPEYGKRIYFGNNPESVSFWANRHKNEGHYILDRALEKNKRGSGVAGVLRNMGEAAAEQFTGGTYSNLLAKYRYGTPENTLDVANIDELKKHLKGLNRNKHNVMFRSSVPTRTLDYMKDLPVARHILNSLPGGKMLLSDFLPQNDPSKDMSIAENLAPEHINRVDIVDTTTGKVNKRINISNAKKSPIALLGGEGHRLSTLKKMIVPALMTAGGGSLIYSALKPNKAREKTGAFDKKTLAKAIAYPALAFGAPMAAAAGVRRALKLDLPEIPTAEEVENMSTRESLHVQADQLAYAKKLLPWLALSSGAIGAGAGALAAPKGFKALAAMAGGYLGGTMGSGAATQSVGDMAAIQADPTHSGLIGLTAGQTRAGRDFMRENPEAVSATQQAMTGAMLGGVPYYVAKQHYPYHTEWLKRKILHGIDTAAPMAKDIAKELSEHLAKKKGLSVGGALAAATLPAGIGYLSLQATESGLRLAGGERKEKTK